MYESVCVSHHILESLLNQQPFQTGPAAGGTTLLQEGPWDPLEGKRYGERLFWAQLVSACLALACEGIYMQMLNNQLGG